MGSRPPGGEVDAHFVEEGGGQFGGRRGRARGGRRRSARGSLAACTGWRRTSSRRSLRCACGVSALFRARGSRAIPERVGRLARRRGKGSGATSTSHGSGRVGREQEEERTRGRDGARQCATFSAVCADRGRLSPRALVVGHDEERREGEGCARAHARGHGLAVASVCVCVDKGDEVHSSGRGEERPREQRRRVERAPPDQSPLVSQTLETRRSPLTSCSHASPRDSLQLLHRSIK